MEGVALAFSLKVFMEKELECLLELLKRLYLHFVE